MSVIVKTEDNKIVCMTKGADNVITERLSLGQKNLLKATLKFVDEYAKEGLRTLLLAKKEIPLEEYKKWDINYCEALLSLDINKDKMLNKLAE